MRVLNGEEVAKIYYRHEWLVDNADIQKGIVVAKAQHQLDIKDTIVEVSYLEYINEQLRVSMDGDREYRKMMISTLNDLKIKLKQLVKG